MYIYVYSRNDLIDSGRPLATSRCDVGQSLLLADFEEQSTQTISIKRMTPLQTAKTTEVAIGCDPFQTRLNCEGSHERIRYQIASDTAFSTQSQKDLPMPIAGLGNDAVRSPSHFYDEFHRGRERCRVGEDSRMGHDPEESG